MRISDWSSDVCSSDLDVAGHVVEIVVQAQRPALHAVDHAQLAADFVGGDDAPGRRILEAVEEAWLADDLLGECGGGSQHKQHAQDFQDRRSEEHTSELQSLMRTSYAVFCLKKRNK